MKPIAVLCLLLMPILCSAAPPPPAALTDALASAAEAAARIGDTHASALSLADVAALWAPLDPDRATALFDQAMTRAKLGTDPAESLQAQAAVLVRRAPLDHAFAAAGLTALASEAASLDWVVRRCAIRRDIALALESLDPPSADALLEQARADARSVSAPVLAAACLRDLAAAAAPTRRDWAGEVMAEASARLDAMSLVDEGRDLARVDLACAWAAWDLPAARDQVSRLPQLGRDEALLAIVRALAPVDPSTAVITAGDIAAPSARALALAICASQLARTDQAAAHALAMQARSLDAGGTDELRVLIAAADAPLAPAEARAIASALTDERTRDEGLASIARNLAPYQPLEAEKTLGAIGSRAVREQGVVGLVASLARSDADGAARQADALTNPRRRAEAFIALARALGLPVVDSVRAK